MLEHFDIPDSTVSCSEDSEGTKFGKVWQNYFAGLVLLLALNTEAQNRDEASHKAVKNPQSEEVSAQSLELPWPQELTLRAQCSEEGHWAFIVFSKDWDADQIMALRKKINGLFDNQFIEVFQKKEFIIVAEQTNQGSTSYKMLMYGPMGDRKPFTKHEIVYMHDILTCIMLQCKNEAAVLPTIPVDPSVPRSTSPDSNNPESPSKESSEPDVKPTKPSPNPEPPKKHRRRNHFRSQGVKVA